VQLLEQPVLIVAGVVAGVPGGRGEEAHEDEEAVVEDPQPPFLNPLRRHKVMRMLLMLRLLVRRMLVQTLQVWGMEVRTLPQTTLPSWTLLKTIQSWTRTPFEEIKPETLWH
jgi:hypothetical protein